MKARHSHHPFGVAGFALALALTGCAADTGRGGGGGGGGGGGNKDLAIVFNSVDLSGGGGDEDGGGGNNTGNCESGEFGCMSFTLGPSKMKVFPMNTDKPPDPNAKDDGVSKDANGWLTLDHTKASSEFVWASNTSDWQKGTVSKFSSKTVREMARYFTTTCFSLGKKASKQPCDGQQGCCAMDSWPQFQNRQAGMASGPYQAINQGQNDPSRTTVDYDGTLFVANRAFSGQSSVTKIANDISQCIDRNGNGKIDTSKDSNGDGIIQTDCNGNGRPDDIDDVKQQACQGGAQEFFGLDDECVLWTTNTNQPQQYGRPLGLGPSPKDVGPSRVWAGTYNDGKFFGIDGGSGMTMEMAQLPGQCRPYGLVVDSDAIGWATNLGSGMCYFNTKNVKETAEVRRPQFGQSGYGIALDRDQNIWVASSNAYRYTPDRKKPINFMQLGQGYWTAINSPGRNNGGGGVLGVAVDSRTAKDYFVYAAGGTSVVQIPGSQIPKPMGMDVTVDGSAYPASRVAGSAKGVGVAADQNVFVIAQGTPVITRVAVDMAGKMALPDIASPPMGNNKCPAGDRCEYKDSNASNPSPYTYSDFTGFGFKNFTRPSGKYSYIVPGCRDGNGPSETEWKKIDWDGDTPPNTTISVKARAGKTAIPDQTWGQWTSDFKSAPADLQAGMPLNVDKKEALFLQVEFELRTTDKNKAPKLKGFEVTFLCGTVPG